MTRWRRFIWEEMNKPYYKQNAKTDPCGSKLEQVLVYVCMLMTANKVRCVCSNVCALIWACYHVCGHV